MIGGTIDPPKSLTHASGICPPLLPDATWTKPQALALIPPVWRRGSGVSLETVMGKVKGFKQRIAGKAKQAAGEIVGDQELHEDGKAEAERGRDEQDKPSELNPLKKLQRLT